MVAPIVAKIGIQAGISVIKKYPWLIPVIIGIVLLPTLFTGLAVYSASTGLARSLTSSQPSQCTKQYNESVNNFFQNNQVVKSRLDEICPPTPAGGGGTEFGDVDDSAFSTLGNTVSPEVQALAAALMEDYHAGRLTSGYFGGPMDHIPQIQRLANGIAEPGCGVDYRVLQTIKIAVDTFGTAGVSDMNRRCTGQIEGAGVRSPHYANGGGHAVDFYALGGSGLTGGDANSMTLLNVLDPRTPNNTYVGQIGCRSASFTNFHQFEDRCNHLHIDFRAAELVALK